MSKTIRNPMELIQLGPLSCSLNQKAKKYVHNNSSSKIKHRMNSSFPDRWSFSFPYASLYDEAVSKMDV